MELEGLGSNPVGHGLGSILAMWLKIDNISLSYPAVGLTSFCG